MVILFERQNLLENLISSKKTQLGTVSVDNNQTKKAETSESTQESIPLEKDLPEGVKTTMLTATENHSGTATVVVVSKNNNFALVLEAKLPDTNVGKEYFAWLAKDESELLLFKIGKLEKRNQVYATSFESAGNFSGNRFVIVTEEAVDDNKAEARVLKGSF